MVKRIIYTILLLVSFLKLQAQTFEWLKTGKGSEIGRGQDIAIDKLGNVYTTGNYWRNIKFDTVFLPGTEQGGSFLVKYNNEGILQWANSILCNWGTDGEHICVDKSGNTFVIGECLDTVKFGNVVLAPKGDFDIFIAKYNSDGNLQWAKLYGGGYGDRTGDINLDKAGNIFITGNFYSETNIGGIELSDKNKINYFFAKLDSNGNGLWAKQADYYTLNDISIGNDNNVYLTGFFSQNINFDSVPLYGFGATDMFVAKYSSSGNFLWVRQGGGQGSDIGFDINTDSSGGIYAMGSVSDVSDFGGIKIEGGKTLIAKYDSSGKILWVRSIASGKGFNVDGKENMYVIGNYFLVAKYDSSGTLIFQKQVVGYGAEANIIDGKGQVFITGGVYGDNVEVFTAKLLEGDTALTAVSAGGNKSICLEDSVTLTATVITGNGPFTYLWSPGGETNTSIRVSPTETTNYTVSLTAINGSIGMDKAIVIVRHYSNINSVENHTICAGSNITLGGYRHYPPTGLWTGGSGIYSPNSRTLNAVYTPSLEEIEAGSVSLLLTLDYQGECTIETLQTELTINPAVVINLGNDTVLSTNDSLVLDAGNSGTLYSWSNGNTIRTIIVTERGAYSVIITNTYGCSDSDTINVSEAPAITAKIDKEYLNNDFSIYPNPASSIFTVTITSTKPKGDLILQISNIIGQNVYSETIKEFPGSFTKQIDLSSLPKGIYYVELCASSEQKKQTREIKKIVLQ